MDDQLWNQAQNAQPPSSTYFGQVTFDLWACALVKGVGKVPFDSNMHKPEQKRTAIDIIITPLPSSNVTFDVERSVIAESREWAGIVLPSIKALGIEAKDLHEKWVRYEMVSTGRTYEAKDAGGNLTGEMRQATTIKFLAVYQTLEEAEVAATAQYGGNGKQETLAVMDNDRQKAAQFLPYFVQKSQGNLTELAKSLAENPFLAKHFTVDSPEVIALLVPQEEIPF